MNPRRVKDVPAIIESVCEIIFVCMCSFSVDMVKDLPPSIESDDEEPVSSCSEDEV